MPETLDVKIRVKGLTKASIRVVISIKCKGNTEDQRPIKMIDYRPYPLKEAANFQY
jgi:hypothetical protein